MFYIKKYMGLFCVLTLLTGCELFPIADNTVAIVNGRNISLSTIQYLQEVDFVEFSLTDAPSLNKLRKQYGKTLSVAILYELISQHLEEVGLVITDKHIDDYENTLRSNFPPEEFEKYITENAIDIHAWKLLLRYQLILDLFKDEILIKSYVPSDEDVEEFYAKHRNSFKLPESYNLQVALSEDKAKLEKIDSLQDLNAQADILQYTVDMQGNTIQKSWQKAIFALKENQCTKILENDLMFTRMCLIKKYAKRDLSMAEAYVYIEKQLAQEHLGEIFSTWLEDNLQHIDVKVSKHLTSEIF